MADDILHTLRPGQKISEADRAKLAKANIDATSEAHRMAADHRSRDERQRPVGEDVADSIKQKLEIKFPKPTPPPAQ